MSAINKLQRAVDKAKTPSEQFKAYEDFAEHYYNHKEYEECLEWYEKELETAKLLKDDFKIAKAHRMIGEALSMCGNHKGALQHQKEYYDYATKDKGRLKEQQQALTTLGRTLLLYGESISDQDPSTSSLLFDQADDYLLKSLKLCEELENRRFVSKQEASEMRAISLLNRGTVFDALKENEKACNEWNLAIRLCEAYHLSALLRQSCFALACLHLRLENFNDAITLFKKALECFNSSRDHSGMHEMCEILVAQEEAYIKRGDIHLARKSLQKAYSLMSERSGNSTIEKRLKIVASMDFAQRQLDSDSELSPEVQYKLYERLGDGFSSRGVHRHALKCYELMLQCCKTAGLDLKPCYVSLAQTAKDAGQFDEAISYFEEELALSSHGDACNSLLLILECQEMLKSPPGERLRTLQRAHNLAAKADDKRLKVKVLTDLEKVQREMGDPEAEDTKEQLRTLRDNLTQDSDSSDSHESSQCSFVDHIDLDTLTDCSIENHEEEFEVLENSSAQPASRPKRNHKRSKPASTWRNEKGETKLHIACISGNINAVRTLLEQGCDVNATDNAGWTPLHEACNHGFVEIVELLLDHGADINFKGGLTEGGITPLHDAASAGNLDVMDVLLRRKASVFIVTDEGQNALDALEQFYERGGMDLTPEENERYDEIVRRLRTCLDKVGFMPRVTAKESTHIRQPRQSIVSRNTDVRKVVGSLRRGIDPDDIGRKKAKGSLSPISISSNSSRDSPVKSDSEDERNGVKEYVQAIQNVRKNNVTEETKKVKTTIPSLLPEEEIVEDWLDDDLKCQPSKRRKTLDQPKLPPSTYKRLSLKRGSNPRTSHSPRRASSGGGSRHSNSSIGSHEDGGSRFRDSPETSFLAASELWEDMDVDFEMRNEELIASSAYERPENYSAGSLYCATPRSRGIQRQATLTALGVTHRSVSPPQASLPYVPETTTPLPLSSQVIINRINVRIEGELYAIPVSNPSLTVGWLSDEAAKRFSKIKGAKPNLRIQTADGAFVADDDPVSFLFGGDEVVGSVLSWDVACITDRYKDACRFVSLEPNNHVLCCLEQSLFTQGVVIVNQLFSSSIFKPVFKAIAMENFSKLNFSNNMLRDEGLQDLFENLGRSANLKVLDISGNGLTMESVKVLARAAEGSKLKALAELNLSYNFLQNEAILPLSILTSATPLLQNLALADCQFTKTVWDNHSSPLTLSAVRSLNLSGNALDAKGLAGFLGNSDNNMNRRLNPNMVETLRLLGTGGSNLCQELVSFYRDNAVALRELEISYDHMQDDDFVQLLGVFESAPNLSMLRVPAAPFVRGDTVCKLLCRQPAIKKLEITTNEEMWNGVDQGKVEAAAIAAAKGIESLTLKGAPVQFEHSWRSAKGSDGFLKKGALGIHVFTGSE